MISSDLIKEAQNRLVLMSGADPTEPQMWLEAHVISNNDPQSRLSLLVLEGSPPRGWIVANRARGFVQVFNSLGSIIFDSRSI